MSDTPSGQPAANSSIPTTPPVFAEDQLKGALTSFKKRLKLTRLDNQSKLGYGPMTKGGDTGVVAIMPPNQFPPGVWQELARQGKLKHVSQGLYELVDGA